MVSAALKGTRLSGGRDRLQLGTDTSCDKIHNMIEIIHLVLLVLHQKNGYERKKIALGNRDTQPLQEEGI
jgi:hypothetical protein